MSDEDELVKQIRSLSVSVPQAPKPKKIIVKGMRSARGINRQKSGKSKTKNSSAIIGRKSLYYNDDEDEYIVPTFFPVEEDHPEWQVVTTAKVNDVHFITKYRSRSTGMELIHCTVQGPTVHCYITLATRAENDDGLANILRNLVYMGSEEYPCPNVLHTLTTKCLASGNTCYTDIDHTCFTMTTAGGEGMLTLLPIYFDHIFFPLLTEASYLTEIYHINANGEDGGSLYKELEKDTNLPDVKIKLALNKAIYDSTSGYRYQYLGLPDNTRDDVDIHKVREYHKKYYVPMNTCLTMCGQVDPLRVFEVIEPCLEKLIFRGRAQSTMCPYEEQWTKPWLAERLVEFDHPVSISVIYPDEKEEQDSGKLVIGFVGPQILYSTEQMVAMRLMMEYLVWGQFSPLQKVFVKSSYPLAGDVKFIEMCHMKSIFAFQFEKINFDNIEHITTKLRKALRSQLVLFDEARMLDIINNSYEQEVSVLEREPHDTIAAAINKDFCYATCDDGLLFDRRVNNSYTIQQFVHQPKSFWIKVLSKGILNQPWVTVDCLPSRDEFTRLKTEEENRIIHRVTTMPEELEVLGHRLEKALQRKHVPVPKEILDAVKAPSMRRMGFHNISSFKNPEWAEDLKCNLLIDDIQTSFAYVTVVMDTSVLDIEQKKFLVLFIQAILKSPVYDETVDRILSPEEVYPVLESDVLSYNLQLGIAEDGTTAPHETIFNCGAYEHNMCLTMQLQMQKVEQGFQWIRKLLWNTRWDKEVLKKLISEMVETVNEIKSDGRKMSNAMLMDFLFKFDSNAKSCSPCRQQTLLKNLKENFSKESDDLIVMLESIRQAVLQPRRMTIHIGANIPKLEFQLATGPQEKLIIYKLLRRTFKQFYKKYHEEDEDEDDSNEKRMTLTSDTFYMKNFQCIKKWAQELILPMKNKDPLSYLIQATPCVDSYLDPEYSIIVLTCHYFVQRGGPFYKEIVMTGLAKECVLRVLPFSGMTFFKLIGCPDVVKAYNVAFDIILSHLNEGYLPPAVWDENILEGARSSIIFNLIVYENTPRNLAMQSLLNNFRKLSVDYTRHLVESLTKVNFDQVKMMTKKYLRELFVENVSCAVAAPAEKVPSIIKEFTNYAGKRFSLMSEVDYSFLSRW